MSRFNSYITFHTVQGKQHTVYPDSITEIVQSFDKSKTWITVDTGRRYQQRYSVIEDADDLFAMVQPYWRAQAVAHLELCEDCALEMDEDDEVDEPIVREDPTTKVPDIYQKAFKKKFPI